MHEIDKAIEAVRTLLAGGARGVLVTVIRTSGSTYRRAGARAVIAEDGKSWGAISGGCLERDLAERIRPWLEEMTPRLVKYDFTRDADPVFGLGLGCRGALDLFVEPFDAEHHPTLLGFAWSGREPVPWTTVLPDGERFLESLRPPRALAIFGSGVDVDPVARIGREIGWDVEVITTRDPIDVNAYDGAVIMTHNVERDAAILEALLASRIPYIGLLGPKSRGDELLAGASAESRARVHSPIGLDLGAETPEEIALSIVAEIQAVWSGGSARELRRLETPIHAPRDLTCG